MNSRLFLSHSSQDDFEAIALGQWLTSEGWNDVFLDIDADRGIAPGQRWERELHAAASRCEAVIFLISANWLASGWCRKEYELARRLNKALFAALIDPGLSIASLPPELKDTWQALNFVGGQDAMLFRVMSPASHAERHVAFSRDALRRLKRGLEKAGIDPRYFAWPPPGDPRRSPYRGLSPLESVDAGVFFGREASIIEAIDRLRGLREAAAPRLFVILGASGAGKSSFMRSGLLPRLERDDRHFIPFAPIRPERAALNGEAGLLGALESALPQLTRAELRAAMQGGAAALRPLLRERAAAGSGGTQDAAASLPAVVIAIDQAEELFRDDGAPESEALLTLVRDLTMLDDPRVIVIFAIRSDAYDALERARPLEDMRQTAFPLLPIPRSVYKDVIEGPARRVGDAGGRLVIEPQLTARLLADISDDSGTDALPLLSFTLEQLYREVHQQGALRLVDYEALGGLKGSIDRAVARAFVLADADPRIPKDQKAREQLLRRGLIPWLAGIDPVSKSPRRNQARLADIPLEALPLVELLVKERLLMTDVRAERDLTGAEARIIIIEPAHEALLRQWGLLGDWLAEDFGLLASLESLQRATRDWNANARADPWLTHRGDRLRDAQTLDSRPDIAAKLDPVDRAYLAACREQEEALRADTEQRLREREEARARQLLDAKIIADAQRRVARRTLAGLAVAVALALGAAWLAASFFTQKNIAERRATETEVALLRVKMRERSAAGDILGAAQFALDAFRKLPSAPTRAALLEAALSISPHMVGVLSPEWAGTPKALAWLDDERLAIAEPHGLVRMFRIVAGAAPTRLGDTPVKPATDDDGEPVNIAAMKALQNGLLLVVYETGAVSALRADGSALPLAIPKVEAGDALGSALFRSVKFSADGSLIALAGSDRASLIACVAPMISAASLDCKVRIDEPSGRAIALSPDGKRVVFARDDGALAINNAMTGERLSESKPSDSVLAGDIEFGPRDGEFLIAPAARSDPGAGELILVDLQNPDSVVRASLGPHSAGVQRFAARGNDREIVRGCKAHGLCLARFERVDRERRPPLRDVEALPGHRRYVDMIAPSEDGSRIATHDSEGSVIVWAWPPDKRVYDGPAPDCGAAWISVAADLKGATLAVATADGVVATLRSGALRGVPECQEFREGGGVIAVSRSADATAIAKTDGHLVVQHDDGTVSSVQVGATVAERQLAWTGAESIWAFVTSDGRVGLVDAASPGADQTWVEAADRAFAFGLTVDHTRNHLLVSQGAGRLRIVDLATRKGIESRIERRRCARREGRGDDETHPFGTSLSVSADGRWLAITDKGSAVFVIDRANGDCRLLRTQSEAMAVAFHPDNPQRLVAIDEDGRITIWRLGQTDAEQELLISPPAALGLPREHVGHRAIPTIVWTPTGLAAVGGFAGLFVLRLDEAEWEARISEVLNASSLPPS